MTDESSIPATTGGKDIGTMKQYPHPDYISLWSMPSNEHADQGEKHEKVKFIPPEGLEVFDTDIPSVHDSHRITVRVYRPKGARNLPVIMNAHGGGFVAGSVDNDNRVCSYISQHVPAVVGSVEYTLAPKEV
ncbi:MAG: alpha/beta hydrolase, partial [Oscillospiraceae bacterium]